MKQGARISKTESFLKKLKVGDLVKVRGSGTRASYIGYIEKIKLRHYGDSFPYIAPPGFKVGDEYSSLIYVRRRRNIDLEPAPGSLLESEEADIFPFGKEDLNKIISLGQEMIKELEKKDEDLSSSSTISGTKSSRRTSTPTISRCKECRRYIHLPGCSQYSTNRS